MQLLIKRGQQATGLISNKISFTMTVRAQYTEAERALINKYSLGGSIISTAPRRRDISTAPGRPSLR